LNKIVAVGVGQVDLSKGWVGYKVYEVGWALNFGVSIFCGTCRRAILETLVGCGRQVFAYASGRTLGSALFDWGD
jgi:hypothetical protein